MYGSSFCLHIVDIAGHATVSRLHMLLVAAFPRFLAIQQLQVTTCKSLQLLLFSSFNCQKFLQHLDSSYIFRTPPHLAMPARRFIMYPKTCPPPPPPFGDSGSSYFLSTPRPQGDYDSSYIWRPKYRTSACFVATSNPPAQSHRKHKMRRERARFTDFNIKTCVSAFQSKTRIPLHVLVLVLWY